MRRAIVTVLTFMSPLASAGSPYEGTWFTCVPEMEGRRNPWSVQSIRLEGGELRVFSEWGTKYSFSGTARRSGQELVIRGCSFYVDKPMESCDPANPPIVERMKLPLRRSSPSRLHQTLKRGESVFVRGPAHFERLAARCEELIDAQDTGGGRR